MTNTNELQPEPIADRLDRLENLILEMGEVVLSNAEAIAQLTASTNQALNLATSNNERIREILEYLYTERPNGRGGNGGA